MCAKDLAAPPSYLEQHDDILIREYVEATDKDQVIKLFRDGMLYATQFAFTKCMQAPRIVLPLLSWAVASGMFFTMPSSKEERQSTSTSRSVTPYSILLTGLVGLILPIGGLYARIQYEWRKYIHWSLGSDLSNIDAAYKGSGGIFIVAVDRKVPEKIVGTIAGEIKDKVSFFPGDGLDDDNSSSSKGSRQQRIMELRRMSVDQDCHKRGIGRRLVQALHHQVKPDVAYLTCTNVQYGAHRLYEQAGYVRQQIPGFKLACFGTLQIWGYKKEFSNNHVP